MRLCKAVPARKEERPTTGRTLGELAVSNETPAPLPVGFRDVDATAPERILRFSIAFRHWKRAGRTKVRALELLKLI